MRSCSFKVRSHAAVLCPCDAREPTSRSRSYQFGHVLGVQLYAQQLTSVAYRMPEITANVSFDTIAREWRCKWSPDADKSSLSSAQDLLASVLAEVSRCRTPGCMGENAR